MRPEENIERFVEDRKPRIAVSADIDKRVLRDSFAAMEETISAKSAVEQPNIWKVIMKAKIAKFAVAVVTIIIIVAYLVPSNSARAWADVVERFGSVPFFKATIYMKKNALGKPRQIEIWRNKQGLARLRYGSQVVFAKDGKVVQAFDLESKSQTEPHSVLVGILAKLGADEFSLETVIQGVSGGQLIDVTPLVNAEATISEDLVVFDIEQDASPQWFRIWALRESKLPTHIRVWDPRDGECMDVILTYSKEQQDIFFDPGAFSSELNKSGNKKVNLAYMFLEDSGGKQIFPGTVDEHQAFKVTTKTIDGREWSLADYKGKTVLVDFWNGKNYRYHEKLPWMKEIYQRFKDRDDFVMVGVSLRRDAESSKAFCEKQGMSWIQLHEPDMGYKNSLARAFGVDDTYSSWMVWKDGTIDKLHGDMKLATGQVEASVIGFTYASEMWLAKKVMERQKLHSPLSTEEIIELCGDSYTVEDSRIVLGGTTWVYEAYSEDKSRIRRLSVEIKDDTVVSWGSSSSLIDPATVTISFSSEFIRDRIESRVEPDVLEKMYKDYKVGVSASKGNVRYPFTKISIKADKPYLRQIPPGIYDFVISIGPTNEYGSITKTIKKILLQKNVRLGKNESKSIRFE